MTANKVIKRGIECRSDQRKLDRRVLKAGNRRAIPPLCARADVRVTRVLFEQATRMAHIVG